MSNNTTGNDTLDGADSHFEQVIGIVVPIIFCLVIIVGFIGNVLVIIVVVSNKQMRNTTNILIVSLAIADLSFIVICVPFTAVNVAMNIWPFGDLWCKIVQYMMFVTAYSSVYTLVLMSFDRYLAVVHAIWAMNYRTDRNAYICICVLWSIILLCNTPILAVYHDFTYPYLGQNRSSCVFIGLDEENTSTPRIVYGIFFAMGYTLPLTLVCLLYGFMLNRLLYGVPPRLSRSAETARSKKRVSRMVIVVVVIFALCWLPNQVMFMKQNVFGHKPDSETIVVIQTVAQVLAYINSCINPILYAFLSENFRKGFRKVLCYSRKAAMRADFERTNTRPLLTRATSLKAMGQINENGV